MSSSQKRRIYDKVGTDHLTNCLVKLHYFQLAFLENWFYKKQKKSIKDQKEIFVQTQFLKYLPTLWVLKIWCPCFSYKQNFLHFLGWWSFWNWRMFIFDNYNGVQLIPNINFVFTLNLQVSIYGNQIIIKRVKQLTWECNFWGIVWSHRVWFYKLMKYNGFLMMFSKIIGIMCVLFHDVFFDQVLEIF